MTDVPPLTIGDTGPENARCGFVSLVGSPNAGKSTLLNALVGAKISIVTPKAQTTRARTLGIAMSGEAQIVLVDTPGIFSGAKRRLERSMISAAWDSTQDVDAILYLIDARKGLNAEQDAILEGLAKAKAPLLLVLNKVDLVERPKLLDLAKTINERVHFAATFMVSALSGSGVKDLLQDLAKRVPAGPWHYPEDQLADTSLRLIAAELTREQLFLQLQDELPYALVVQTDQWQERPDGSVRIEQTITLERPGQKMIVIGANGQKIKAIGQAARREMMKHFERTVHLFLHVKVRENWTEDRSIYSAIGLNFKA